MEAKEMILHIGLGKCGSSSLQSFFALNNEMLSSLGIYYPEVEIDLFEKARRGEVTAGNGGELARSFLNKKHFFFCEGKRERLDHLKGLIRSHQEKNMLVSSEMFSVLTKREALNFIKKINAWGLRAHVICYIRRQDEMALSSYVQGLIAGHSITIRSFDEEVLRSSKRFRYSKLLKPWINLPKGNRHTVKVFDKRKLKNEDVVVDFLSLLGIDPKAHDFNWPKKINLSLNAVSSYLIYQARKEGLANDVVQRLVQASRTFEWKTADTVSLNPLSREKRKKIMDGLKRDNAKIAKTIGKPDDALFDSPNENNFAEGESRAPDLVDAFPLIRHFLEEIKIENGEGIDRHSHEVICSWINSAKAENHR
jgi:hypothetical protein